MSTPDFRSNAKTPVSGELTDTELLIEGRIEETLNAPRFMADSLTPSSVGYALMQEDLKMRSAQNEALRQEQQLAFSSSARRRMHEKAIENDRQSADAKSAVNRVPAMIEAGMTKEDIEGVFFAEDPTRATNPFFASAMNGVTALAQTKQEKWAQDNSATLAELRVGTDLNNARTALAMSENQQEWIETLVQTQQKAGMTAHTQAKIDELKTLVEYNALSRGGKAFMDATGTSVADWQKMTSNLTGKGFAILDTSTFSENGPSNQFEAMGLGSDVVLGLIASNAGAAPDGLQDAIREIKTSISDVSDPDLIARANDPNNPDTEARDRISKGRGYIKQAGNVFSATYESEIVRKERQQKIEEQVEEIAEINGELAKGYQSTADSLNALLGETGTQYAGEGLERNKVLEARSTAMNYIERIILEKGQFPSTSFSTQEMRDKLLNEKDISVPESLSREDVIKHGVKHGLWVAIEHAPQPRGRVEDVEGSDETITRYDGNSYRPVIMAWLDSEVRRHIITDKKKIERLKKRGLIPTGTSSNRAEIRANINQEALEKMQAEAAEDLDQEALENMQAQKGQGDDYSNTATINTSEDEKRASEFTVFKDNQNENK